MKRTASLRAKLIITFLGVALISVASVAMVTYRLARTTLTEQAGRTLYMLAQSQSSAVGNEIIKQIDLMLAISHSHSSRQAVSVANGAYQGAEAAIFAQIDQLDQDWRAADEADNNDHPLVQSILSNDLSAELVDFQTTFPDHIEIFVTDRYGALLAATRRTSDFDRADEGWWQTTFHNGWGDYYISEPKYNQAIQSYAIDLAVPILDETTAEVIGILRSTYNIGDLTQIIANGSFGETIAADLFFPNGEMIAANTGQARVDPNVLNQLMGNSAGYAVFEYRDRLQMVSLKKVPFTSIEEHLNNDLGWNLVVYQDTVEILRPVEAQTRNTVFVSIGVFLFATILALIAARSLANPITRLTAVAGRLGAGDLNVQAKVESKDEIGELADTFNQMTDQLRLNMVNEQTQREYLEETIAEYADFMAQIMQGKLKVRLPVKDRLHNPDDPLVKLGNSLNDMAANLHRMIAQTSEAANNLGSAASEILAATTQQASGATEQSAAITQTTTTANEVKVISEQSSLQLNEVASASQRTVEIARSGQKSVQEMIESMAQIKDRVEVIAANTLALAEKTQQIGDIITTVNEIATQSNMLALNASVEAARAGEHGMGFAVVAMEVRNLAEQSRQATSQVSKILSEIQRATNSTVMATEEGAKGVDGGVQLAAQARESIERLSGSVNEATQVATQVVASGQQLQMGIEQIAVAIQQISQVTVQSLATTHQTEKSAQNLNELARRLNEDIAQYEL